MLLIGFWRGNRKGKIICNSVTLNPLISINYKVTSQVNLGEEEVTAEIIQPGRRCFACGSRQHMIRNCKSKKKRERKQPRQDNESHLTETIYNSKDHNEEWIIDSGATANMCKNKKLIYNFQAVFNQQVFLADAVSAKIMVKGKVKLPCLTPVNVTYVPKLKHNLISVSSLAKEDFTSTFYKNKCVIKGENHQMLTCCIRNNVYRLSNVNVNNVYENVCPHKDCIHLWHLRLSHGLGYWS